MVDLLFKAKKKKLLKLENSKKTEEIL